MFVFLVGLVIFISDDTIAFGTNVNSGYLMFKYMVYLIVTLGLMVNLKLKIFRSNGFYFLCAIVSSIIFTSLSHLDFVGGYIYQIWIVFLAFLIAQFLDFEVFTYFFKKYIFVLSLLSVLVFVIANYHDWVLDYFPSGENSAGVEFANLYIGSVYKGVSEIRNASVFREPGVFVIYILLAVIFEIFISNKLNKSFLAVVSIALITTFSTAGVLILFVLIIGYMFKEDVANFQSNKILIASIFVIFILIFSSRPELYEQVFSKLSSDSASFGSATARIASILVNLVIFANHPFFGSGLGDYGGLFEEYSSIYFGEPLEASGQSTNSFLAIFATYGLLYGLIVLYALMCLTKKISRSFVVKCVLCLSFGLMFSSQDMRYSLLFYILVFYGIKISTNIIYRAVSD